MANEKKYMSLERMQEYTDLMQADIAEADTATLESAKSHSDANLAAAQVYADNAAAQKSQVQIITWGADD